MTGHDQPAASPSPRKLLERVAQRVLQDGAAYPEIAVGQVWRSLDKRDLARGRTVEIEDFDRDFVRVLSYFGDDAVVRRGRRSRIHRSRFDGVQFEKVVTRG